MKERKGDHGKPLHIVDIARVFELLRLKDYRFG
jgi:hypothetical protein